MATGVDLLDRILATKRAEVDTARQMRPRTELDAAVARADPPRGFVKALADAAAGGRIAVIAEVKKASPSKGLLCADFAPAAIARAYERGGATCLSVLTDAPWFQGSTDDFVAARAACALPVLRKDFVVDAYQLAESRALGADCVLLIVAALADGALAALADEALGLGLDVLVEAHDAAELDRALALVVDPARVAIGVNNRDLRTFETRLDTTLALLPRMPPGRALVAESGIATRDDVRRLREAGVGACLVGEAFMRAPDPGEALAALFG